MPCYDIIGDIHGQAGKLRQLLGQLGYELEDGVYIPGPGTTGQGDNKIVFLGDFIDRGPDNRRVIEIVRPMVENGHALAVMGNHEFNAICYHTQHPATGEPLRAHSEKNQGQHQTFLDDYPLGEEHTRETIDWFMTLPLFLELETNAGLRVYEVDDEEPQRRVQFSDHIRIVHACWDQSQVDYIICRLGTPALIDEPFLLEAFQEGSPAFEAIEMLLKGPEIPLPDGARFFDKDGNARRNVRYQWWAGGRSYRDVAIVPADQRSAVPDLPLAARYREPIYAPDAPPVFFGHYWMNGEAQAQRHNVACLDYSAGKGGPLAAYRWLDGGSRLGAGCLRGDQFITTDDLESPPLDHYTYPEEKRRAAWKAWKAAKNSTQLHSSDRCGCFYCLSVFEPVELEPDDDWPQCPRCGVDYLVGSASGLPLTKRFLAEVKEFWLEPPFPDPWDKD